MMPPDFCVRLDEKNGLLKRQGVFLFELSTFFDGKEMKRKISRIADFGA